MSFKLTELLIGAAITVHRELGPGLLESTYEECLVQDHLLINFNIPLLKYGIGRFVSGLERKPQRPLRPLW